MPNSNTVPVARITKQRKPNKQQSGHQTFLVMGASLHCNPKTKSDILGVSLQQLLQNALKYVQNC